MSTKNRLMAVAAVSLVTLGSNAYAVDRKVMPGSACQPRSPDNGQDIFALLDGVTNSNPTDLAFVLCPIVRDNTSTNPNGLLQVQLLVKGSSNDELVSCVLDSRQANGTRIQRDEAATDGGLLGLIVKQNARIDGYYVVQCALPPGGTVVSYSYVESSPTDENN
ncbi:MAG: hypothetical protein ACREXS_20305 [Gammaproteobacteria bacterium]